MREVKCLSSAADSVGLVPSSVWRGLGKQRAEVQGGGRDSRLDSSKLLLPSGD